MTNPRTVACALLSCVVLLLSGCGALSGSNTPSSTGNGMVAMTVGVAATQSSTPLILGKDHGFFQQNGIDLTLGQASTGAGAITQVINGQQQAGLGGISPVVIAAAANIPVEIVSGSVSDRPDPVGAQYQTMVAGDSSIHSFRDLENRTVAVNSLKCCWEFWLREAVSKAGGDPDKVKLVQLSFPDEVTALKQGKVDAISTAQPYATSLRQEGYRDIGDTPAIAFDNPNADNTVYYMAKSFIAEHPGIVDKWRRALQQSSDYANSHPDETRAAIVKQTSADPQLIASAPLPSYTAEVERSVVEKEASFDVKYGAAKSAPDYSTYVVP